MGAGSHLDLLPLFDMAIFCLAIFASYILLPLLLVYIAEKRDEKSRSRRLQEEEARSFWFFWFFWFFDEDRERLPSWIKRLEVATLIKEFQEVRIPFSLKVAFLYFQ